MKQNLKKTAFAHRLDVLEMCYGHKAGHIGGSMSCMDILTVLYYDVMDIEKIKTKAADRDRFIMSKGHCAEAYYAVLAGTGFIGKEELDTFTAFDTRLAEHPSHKIPGVEIATGALGHGLPVGVGMALGLRDEAPKAHVYVLMGDGELAEGSVWEASMAAAKYRLSNLTCIIDRNRLQISGGTEEVMPLDELGEKYRAFGFEVIRCNGHDYEALGRALRTRHPGKPMALIADTVKGFGSPVMEDKAPWHHAIPTAEQYEQIKADLMKAMEEG
ncbi:MAG: transketolase [Lachnospiraceae bacterium]|jgi:transketolase|nr:transketolase [Lachnospiraceae bacterium]